MPLLTQSNLPPLPKELQQRSSLDFNPFVVSNDVDERSAQYNQGQAIDALQKIALQQPLNNQLRKLTPLEISQEKSLPSKAITEQQAFDAYLDVRGDPSGTWADPSNFKNLAKVQLAELEQSNPEAFKSYVDRYQNSIKGAIATPSFIPDLRSEKAIDATQDQVGGWSKQMKEEGVPGITRARERRMKDNNLSKISKKNYTLKDKDRRALSDIVNNMENHANNPAEQSFLSEVASGESLQTNMEVIEQDLGVNEKNRKYFSSVATLALTNFTDVIRKHKHDSQIMGRYFGIDPANIETDESIDIQNLSDEELFDQMTSEANTPADKKQIKTSTSLQDLKQGIALRNKQPLINGMMVTLDKFIRSTMNPDGIISSTPSKSLKGAGSLLRYWTEQGYLSWGRTKKGYITPIVSSNYGIGNISETEIATAFDPSLRQKKYSTINAPTYPAISNITNISKADWKAFTKNKDIKGRSTISKNFLSMVKSNPVRIKSDMLFFLNRMKKELDTIWNNDTSQGTGSNHPYAATLGEISQADYQVYVRRDTEAAKRSTDGVSRPGAAELIQNHYLTIGNKLSDLSTKLKEQEIGNLKYYPLWYKSGPTGRYFVMDSLFNHINDKGLVRTVLKIGHDIPINITDPITRDGRRVLDLAREIYSPKGKGLFLGENINAKLKALPTAQKQLLGFYYALGKTAHKYGISNYGKTIENPIEAIENGIQAFDAMANEGNQLRSFLPTKQNPDGAMPPHAELTANQQKFFSNNKGEWQYPVGLAIDASKLKEALAKGDNNFTFEFTFEEDARQSNAALISTLIGDYNISGLLGLLPDLAQQKIDPVTGRKAPAEDLRDLLVSTLPQTVAATLNNEQETEKARAQAVTNYFDAVLKDESINGSKVITRGLIVAGLYGKYPGYMYSEAEDMLAKTANHTSILSEAYATGNPSNADGVVDTDALTRDISQVYLSLAQEHMANLMGYQNLMKSIGKVLGVLDGPTEIDGVFPGEKILLAIEELYPMLSDKIVGDEIVKLTEDVGGFTFPIFDRQTKSISTSPSVYAQRIVARANEEGGEVPISGTEETEAFNQLGSQVARALPVNVIQNMDSLALAMSFMVAHNANGSTPPAATAVHDAIISTADSVLLLNNAYNNVVPHMFAQGGKPFFEQLMKTLHVDTVFPLMRTDDNAKINIGTEITVKQGGGLTQLSGITNYFDEIYNRTLPGREFFSEEQKNREATFGNERLGESNGARAKRMKAADEAFIFEAEKAGYLPPRPNNIVKRRTYSVSGADLKKLIMLIMEREGLFNDRFAANYKSAFKLDNVSNLNNKEVFSRSRRNGRRYDEIKNTLDSFAKKKWAQQNKYNRQLD